MPGIAKILVVGLLAALVGGLVVCSISNVRNSARLMQCQNNLRQIGVAVQNYDSAYGHFPTGTVANAALPPDRRLSWLTRICPAFMCGGIASQLDNTKAWDDDLNSPPRWRIRIDMNGATREELIGEVRILSCPANPAWADNRLPSPTHYMGLAGLGEHAAELPLSDPGAGLFGYDRLVSLKDIKDGAATTIAVAEVMDGGPWTAGGRATVRGLVLGGPPDLGERGQFASLHRDGTLFLGSRPAITNVLFADASVRRFSSSVTPAVFEALATIAGGEQVDELPP